MSIHTGKPAIGFFFLIILCYYSSNSENINKTQGRIQDFKKGGRFQLTVNY